MKFSKLIPLAILSVLAGNAAADISVTNNELYAQDQIYPLIGNTYMSTIHGYGYIAYNGDATSYDDPSVATNYDYYFHLYQGYGFVGGSVSQTITANTVNTYSVQGYAWWSASSTWVTGDSAALLTSAYGFSYSNFTLDTPGSISFASVIPYGTTGGVGGIDAYFSIDGVHYGGSGTLALAPGYHYVQAYDSVFANAGSEYSLPPFSHAESRIDFNYTVTSGVTPEPASMAILGASLGLLLRKKRKLD